MKTDCPVRSHGAVRVLAALVASALCVFSAAGPALAAAPGEVATLNWCTSSKTCLQWSSTAGATQYRLYRGAHPSLPCAVNPASDSCDKGTFTATSTGSTVTETPAAAALFWYLVTAQNGSGEGSPGSPTTGTRQLNVTGTCGATCNAVGQSCTSPGDCCSENCQSNVCVANCCQALGGACLIGASCCTGACAGGLCVAAPTCSDGIKNGTETDIDCGGNTCPACLLGKQCAAGSDCVTGACQFSLCVCAPPYADCNSNPGDGCEINTGTDTSNCGLCGKICSPFNIVPSCSGGICNGTCSPGYADCNGNKQIDGCEISIQSDPTNCGGCGTVCSSNNLTPVCTGGSCNGPCNTGFADCNANEQVDGCEISLQTNPNNCGQCGKVCSPNNITPTCGGGTCNGTCSPGYADCNANKQLDGCEVSTQADATNCGGCGTVCSANHVTPSCGGGVCNGACNTGYSDCDGNKQANGCEINTAADTSNCGGCGTVCSTNHITPSCGGGVCNGTCSTGYADCNGNKQLDGCEINLQNDPNNCGLCGKHCVIGAICSAGSCTIP